MATFEQVLDPVFRGMDARFDFSVTDSAGAARDYTGATIAAIFYPSDPTDIASSFSKAGTLDTPTVAPQFYVLLADTDTDALQAAQWITVKIRITLASGDEDIVSAKFQLLKETGA